jgi:VCBS repeat-containing protein
MLSVSGTPTITAVDGNNESYTLPDGTASVNNGTLSVDPTKLNGLGAGESVDITVTYNVSDGTTTTQNTATITVTGVNDAPTANNDTADVIVGFAFSGNVINSTMNGEDTDSDNSDILSITGFASADGVSGTVDDQNGLSGRYGTLALNSDGSLTYNADLQTALDLTFENAAVTDNFTYTVSDGNGGTGTATLSFSIKAPEPGDGPPLVSPINISVTENDEAFSANLLAGQSDPNGDNLSIYGRPIITAIDSDGNEYPWSETAISVSDNILSIEPGMVGELDDGESVDFIVTYNVSDGNQSVQNTATITVAGVNDAPIVTATYEVTTEDNEPLSIDLMAKQLDPDGDDKSISGTPTITAVDGNNQSFTLPDGTASVNNGTLSVDPTKLNSLGAGESVDITVTYDVSDGTTTTQNTATVTVTGVNDAPIVRAITDSKTEDAASFDTDLLSGQTDPDGDMLSVSGTPTITAVDGNNQSYTLPDGTASVNNGTLSVDPTKLNSLGAGESLDITVTYDVSDGTTTTQNTATITVTGVNDAPTANENAITIAEDPTHTFSADEFNFTDIDGDVLNSIDVKSLPAKGELTLSGSAVKQNQTIFASQISDLVYTPILNDVGKDYSSFTFTVNDGETDSASTYTMNIHVTGQNDPPEVVPIIDARTEDDAAFTKNLTLGQTDPDDDNLSVTDSQIKAIFANGDAVTLPTGTVSLDGNYLTINPNLLNAMPQGESVVITVTYDISDGELTATNTATITISGRNDAPVSFGKNIELNGEAPISLTREDFAFNDIDGDDLDKVTIETTPTNGLLYLNGMEVQGGDGIPAESLIDLVYKPGVGASGSNYDAFTFSVNDGQDKSLIHALTIGVNAAPTAEDDIVSSPEDTSFFGQMKATDLDSAKLTYRITQEPEHGTVTVVDNGPDYIYLPDPHYYGPDSFIFEASDGTLTDAGEVDIDVTPENDRPIQRYEIKDVSLLEGQKAKIFITQAFAEIDALDPTLSGFNNAIEKLFKDGRFGDDDQLSDLPVSGQLTYSATGLPDGLELNSSNRIGGKSNELGTFPIVVRATDGEGEYREISFKLTVSNPVINSFPERKIDIPLESLVDIVQEEIPELNDHNLPPVLKVKPKRDGIIPKHSTDANVTSPLTTFDNNSLSDENSLTQGHWLNTRVSSQQDLSGNIRVVAMDVKDAEISVQIADQAVDAAERFEGEMSDGTRLPDWITVDAATGLTKAEPPQGAGPIEMRVVAEDNAGNTRSIDIILETSLLKNNIESVETFERTPREIKREARQAAREARQEERQKEREARQNDRTVASSAKQLTRSRTNVEALIDGRVVFTDEQAALGDGGIRLLSMASEDALLKIQIDDIQRADETRYEIRMTDGSITPGWVRINPLTGELTIDAPEDTDILDLQLIAIQGDLQRSIQLQLTPKELLQSRPDDVEKATKAIQEETLNQDGIETVEQPVELSPDILKGNESGHFVPLDAQIEDALAENQYGRDIQYALQDNT